MRAAKQGRSSTVRRASIAVAAMLFSTVTVLTPASPASAAEVQGGNVGVIPFAPCDGSGTQGVRDITFNASRIGNRVRALQVAVEIHNYSAADVWLELIGPNGASQVIFRLYGTTTPFSPPRFGSTGGYGASSKPLNGLYRFVDRPLITPTIQHAADATEVVAYPNLTPAIPPGTYNAHDWVAAGESGEFFEGRVPIAAPFRGAKAKGIWTLRVTNFACPGVNPADVFDVSFAALSIKCQAGKGKKARKAACKKAR